MRPVPNCATGILPSISPKYDRSFFLAAIRAGALNFRCALSHRERDHVGQIEMAREAARELGTQVDLLLDLSSSRPRVGRMPPTRFAPGDRALLVDAPCAEEAPTPEIPVPGLRELAGSLEVGHRVLFMDGLIGIRVVGMDGEDVEVECVSSADEVRATANTFFPDSEMRFEPIMDADIALMEELRARDLRVDWVALSFASDPAQVRLLREVVTGIWPTDTPRVMSKIETVAGIRNLESVIRESDGIMVARGDLGMALPPERLPKTAEATRSAGKVLVIATQFMDVLGGTGVVNRAELSDMALAIRQGAHAIMLSSDLGRSPDPISCLELLRRVIEVESGG